MLETCWAAKKDLPRAKDATFVREMDRKRPWGQTTLLERRYDKLDRRSMSMTKDVWVVLKDGHAEDKRFNGM